MGLCQPGPVGEVAGLGRSVEAEEAANGLARGRRAARLAQRVAALGVEPGARLHGGVAPQHRSHVVALAALAPGHQVGVDALSQLLVQLVLVERPAPGQRSLRGARHLLERRARGESLLGGQKLDLPAELCAKLAVVAGDQGAPVEREVAGSERMNGPADDVCDDEIAGVDRAVVGLAGDALGSGRQRQERRVASEVRGGAGGRLREAARSADGQPGASQPEGENLIGVHREAPFTAAERAAPGATARSVRSLPRPDGRRPCRSAS